MLLLALAACDPTTNPDIDYVAVEESCLATGGALKEHFCCEGVLDYPATCEASCECSPPEESWTVLYCDCGIDLCFDGRACIHEPFGAD